MANSMYKDCFYATASGSKKCNSSVTTTIPAVRKPFRTYGRRAEMELGRHNQEDPCDMMPGGGKAQARWMSWFEKIVFHTWELGGRAAGDFTSRTISGKPGSNLGNLGPFVWIRIQTHQVG
jgi:hypothetical protein